MKIMLGFGDTEKRHEEKIENAFREHVTEQYTLGNDYCFMQDFVEKISEWADAFAKQSQKTGNEYKMAEIYPDRYSYFWATTIADASHIVFILKFHHINRRHAMSPDGWALMTSERIFYVDTEEAERGRKAA